MKLSLPWALVVIQAVGITVFMVGRRSELLAGVGEKMTVHPATSTGCPVRQSFNSRVERFTNYDRSIYDRIEALISRSADAGDPELVQLVGELMDPPATSHTLKLSRNIYVTPQAQAVISELHKLRNGFFVEVGGYDGERSSNTLHLEWTLGWSGLLIEADPFFYAQLLGKNRRSWSINACLSPTNYVTKLRFADSYTGQGHVVFGKGENKDKDMEGGNEKRKTRSHDEPLSIFGKEMVVPCFPLESMLLALKRDKVDFFSLDVEGLELDILQTLDLGRLDVRTLAVEYAHGNRTACMEFMESKGYSLVTEINVSDPVNFLFANDFVFAMRRPKKQ